jgi:3-dehydroquinate dehydratase-2
MTKAILVLNGPNLNMLGSREPSIYGAKTLKDIAKECQDEGKKQGCTITFEQTNSESELISWIQQTQVQGIVVNAGAYTHTSVALRDALLSRAIPFVEVHLSNVFAREAFRHHSFLSDIALGVVTGLGSLGYRVAIEALSHHLKNK